MRVNLPDLVEGADFIELIDKVYDVMTSQKRNTDKEERCGYGVYLDKQINVIDKFIEIISKVRIGNQLNILPFQEGFIVSLQSLKNLYSDMIKDDINKLEYILTSRLSLECVFEVIKKIKTKDSTEILPNAVEAKAQLRLLLIGANKDFVTNNINEENSTEESCVSSQVLGNIPELLEEVLKNKDPDHDLLLPDIITDEIDQKYAQLIQEIATDQTIEKAEDFSHKFHPELAYDYSEEIIDSNCPTIEHTIDPTTGMPLKKKKKIGKLKEGMWIQMLTRGGVKVSTKWSGKFREFETDFNALHNTSIDFLNREPDITTKLIKVLNSKWPKLDSRILKRYSRLRTQIRLRFVMKRYEQQEQQWVVVEQQ